MKTFVPCRSGIVRSLAVMIAVAGVAFSQGCAEPKVVKQPFIGVLKQGSFERGWQVEMTLANTADSTAVDKDHPYDPANPEHITMLDVRDSNVYVYTSAKRVTAFDRKSGTLKFRMDVYSPLPYLLPLVELKNMIVFPNGTSLEVFDDKGTLMKSVPLPLPLRSNAVGEGTTVFFGSAGSVGGLVQAFDVAKTYKLEKWTYMTRDRGLVTAGPAVYNGIEYSASEQGEVDAVNSSNRAQVWDTDHGAFRSYDAVTADLKVDESGLYIASRDSNMYCVVRTTGKLKWQYFAGVPLLESPALTIDTVYQYVPGKGLAALDKNTGAFNRSPRWIHPTATQFLAQDDKYAYLVDPQGDGKAIIAVDKMTGMKAFESDRKDFAVFGVNHKDGTIYAATTDGKVMTVKPVLKAGEIGELVMGN